jgi:hypothetical protein
MSPNRDQISVAGLVIGLTFVAAFLAITVGLVGHGLIKRCRRHNSGSGLSSRNSWMRSPGHEDQTPPELRPGSNSGHPSYTDNSRRGSNRSRHIPGQLPGHGVSTTPKSNAQNSVWIVSSISDIGYRAAKARTSVFVLRAVEKKLLNFYHLLKRSRLLGLLFERTRRRKLRSNFRRSGSEFIILRMHL